MRKTDEGSVREKENRKGRDRANREARGGISANRVAARYSWARWEAQAARRHAERRQQLLIRAAAAAPRKRLDV